MKYDKNEHTKSHRQHPAGADPKVYSYDLQLNLDKNGSSISISASVTPAETTKSYQWQRSTWTNIEGATSGRYTPVAADMGENVRIRVKVTAEGYLGAAFICL